MCADEFLMVGHTHEDIDGLFGVLSHKLGNAFTPHEMASLLLEAQRSAARIDLPGEDRSGTGIDHGHLPTDGFDSRITKCVPNWMKFFVVIVSFCKILKPARIGVQTSNDQNDFGLFCKLS